MSKTRIVVATRRSALALAQCRQFLQRLGDQHDHVDFEELHVVTTGDKVVDRPLAEIGGKGLFLKEIEEKLLEGAANVAVHSMKDVPPEIHPDLMIACIPQREDPRDVLVTTDGRAFDDLPRGAKLGTSSLRRGVQLKELRPDLEVVPIRGNVGTRIEKCRRGDVDATVLAMAGINRLGLQDEVNEILTPEQCLPAVGQGALAIEIRRTDRDLLDLLLTMQCEESALISHAERGVMTAVEGDCKTPVASFGQRQGNELYLRALLAEPDGSRLRRGQRRVPFPRELEEATQLGLELGRELRAG